MAHEIARPGEHRAASEPVRCARCGAPFHCGIDDPDGCWCAKLPPLPRADYASTAGCLCERCLRRALSAQLDRRSEPGA
jgi:ribosomal protein L34E